MSELYQSPSANPESDQSRSDGLEDLTRKCKFWKRATWCSTAGLLCSFVLGVVAYVTRANAINYMNAQDPAKLADAIAVHMWLFLAVFIIMIISLVMLFIAMTKLLLIKRRQLKYQS